MPELATITIDALSRMAGVPVEAIRTYESMGLISRPIPNVEGLPHYQIEDLDRVRFARRSEEYGFSLTAVRGFIEVEQTGKGTCADIYRIGERDLDDLRHRRPDDRLPMEGTLARLLSACPRAGLLEQCPIMATLRQPAAETLRVADLVAALRAIKAAAGAFLSNPDSASQQASFLRDIGAEMGRPAASLWPGTGLRLPAGPHRRAMRGGPAEPARLRCASTDRAAQGRAAPR